jgi:hypothetical protein
MVGRYFSEFLAIPKKILRSRHKYQSWVVTQFGGFEPLVLVPVTEDLNRTKSDLWNWF